jgi:DNA (cytosine-5)-methyltransferase 1
MDAGFEILLGVDNDATALLTFKYNHGSAEVINANLSSPEAFCDIDEHIKGRAIDVIIAGPPCQGFSLTGPRDFDDVRNKLYLAVFEAVKRYQPKGFIIENVPGMATLYKGEIKGEILRRFDVLGYNIDCRILLAAEYGVPQMRKRLIFIGVQKEIGEPYFPEPVLGPSEYITCREAIGDLPAREDGQGLEEDRYSSSPLTDYQKRMRGDCEILFNHVATAHKQFVIDVISLVPEGCNYKSLPKGVGENRIFHEAWTRYHGSKPSKTIDTGHRNHFHYELNRIPTVRENARLQSFPDDFRFFGNRTQQNKQVGNAVPPLLGYYLGKTLADIISGDEECD